MILSVNAMHVDFLHLFDKQSNFSSPEITPEEIDLYLNSAQEALLNALTEEGIEKTQDWSDYTKNITISYQATPFTNSTNKPNGVYVNLPADYRLVLLEEASVEFTECFKKVTKRVPVVPKTRDQYNRLISDPFNKPWKEELIRLSKDNNRFEIIGDTGITIKGYYMDYLIEPPAIKHGAVYSTPSANVDCALDLKAANKIVNMAVNEALKTLGDDRLPLIQLDPLINKIN